MDTIRQDIRYAFRRLFKSPGFTIVGLLTLALGIGANTAIFSVVNAVLLQPLPYADPEQLVGIFHVSEGRRVTMSGPNFTDVRRLNTTLRDAAALTRSRMILTGAGEPARLDTAEVSASLFDLLGVPAMLGRTFRPDENEPGRTHVAVLGHDLWRQRFGADPEIVGRQITLDGVSHEVVGVMPRGFSYPAARALWTPLEYTDNFTAKQRAAWYLQAVGRTRPGVSAEQAAAEIETIGRQLAREYPDSNEGVGMTAVSLHEAIVGADLRSAFWVLLGAVGFVLLIACVNVANLLLARAASREGEIAVRTALGANRGRLVRQLMTESIMLSVVGGGLGLLLAVWGVEALIGLEPQGIPRLDEVRVDRLVILFTLALSVITGVLFGIVPAWQSTRGGISATLKEGGRGALTTRGGARLRTALVVAEVALAVTLLAGAGLLIRSFGRLAAVDPGFPVAPALAFELSLPDARYGQPAQQVAFFDQLMPRLEAIPGVERAAGVISLPLSGTSIVLTFEIAGRPPVPPSQQPAMQVRIATPGYFETIGIPLRKGRLFTRDDRMGRPQVALITEAAARQYFPNEDPIGKRITLGWGRGGSERAGGEVVGVIGDIKDAGLAEPNPPQIYLPYGQWPVQTMSVLLRTAVPPAGVAEAARSAVYAVDGNLPVGSVRTLEQLVARSISQPRFYMTLLALFAGVAVTLAAIGIFGVLSYAVTQRTREIGIRLALGARQATVLQLVVRDAMLMTMAGLAIGLAASFGLTQWLVATLLFETSPHDPGTFLVVSAVLATVSLFAAYVPARRATRVDPIVALRAE